MQLPFAVIPLVMFTSDKKKMGKFVNPWWLKIAGYASGAIIIGLNIYLLKDKIGIAWLIASIAAVAAFAAWVMFGYKGTRNENQQDEEPLAASA